MSHRALFPSLSISCQDLIVNISSDKESLNIFCRGDLIAAAEWMVKYSVTTFTLPLASKSKPWQSLIWQPEMCAISELIKSHFNTFIELMNWILVNEITWNKDYFKQFLDFTSFPKSSYLSSLPHMSVGFCQINVYVSVFD